MKKSILFAAIFAVATFFFLATPALAQRQITQECSNSLGELDSYLAGLPQVYNNSISFSIPTNIFTNLTTNCGAQVKFDAILNEASGDNLSPVAGVRQLLSPSDTVSYTIIPPDPIEGRVEEPTYFRLDLYTLLCDQGSSCPTLQFNSYSFCFSSDGGMDCYASELPEPDTEASTNICNQVPGANKAVCCTCVTGNASCVNTTGGAAVAHVWTAIGCISTNPTNMIATVMRVGLSVAGGVTILVILSAGFLFSTSQGDPKRTSDAKDMLTSAVVGLLFIIFSVTILEFIGVDVLKIPGFGA